MMTIICPQTKPITVTLIGVLLILAALYSFIMRVGVLSEIVLIIVIGAILIFYRVDYEIGSNFDNYKRITLLGLIVFKKRLSIDFPDYISVFSAQFRKDNEWGAISALGSRSRTDAIVIRFFKDNDKFTVYKTDRYEKALQKAHELGKLLNVEVYNAFKN